MQSLFEKFRLGLLAKDHDNWRDVRELIRTGALCGSMKLGVLIKHSDTAECWAGSSVDWALEGIRSEAAVHGLNVHLSFIVRFISGAPHLALLLDIFKGEHKEPSTLPPPPPRLLELIPRVASWSVACSWDEARIKNPKASATKFRNISSAVRDAVGDSATVLLSEPGFHHVLPTLLSGGAADITACPGGDAVQARDLRRRRTKRPFAVLEDPGGSFDAVVVLTDTGLSHLRSTWMPLLLAAKRVVCALVQAPTDAATDALVAELGGEAAVEKREVIVSQSQRFVFLIMKIFSGVGK